MKFIREGYHLGGAGTQNYARVLKIADSADYADYIGSGLSLAQAPTGFRLTAHWLQIVSLSCFISFPRTHHLCEKVPSQILQEGTKYCSFQERYETG